MDRNDFVVFMKDIEGIVEEMLDTEYEEGYEDGYDAGYERALKAEEEDNDGREEV